jgi:hypothetical protein
MSIGKEEHFAAGIEKSLEFLPRVQRSGKEFLHDVIRILTRKEQAAAKGCISPEPTGGPILGTYAFQLTRGLLGVIQAPQEMGPRAQFRSSIG